MNGENRIEYAQTAESWQLCRFGATNLLVLFIQFSDLMIQSLGKIFVSPLSSVAQIGVVCDSSEQFVLQPFVSSCAPDNWMVINSVIAEMRQN